MSELPEGWELVPLLDYVKFLPTGVGKYSGKIEYYSTGSIQDNTHTPEGFFTYKERPSRANRIAQLGDVFQARMKETDKGILINGTLANKLFSTGFIQLRPYENTYDNKLLFYYVSSKLFLDQRDELATGSTQEALTDTKATDLQIPFPPLNEQSRIVAKIDKLVDKVDACEKRLAKIPIILKSFRQSVLAAACSGRLTADWRIENPLSSVTKSEEISENDFPETWSLSKIVPLLSSIRRGMKTGPFGSALKKHEHQNSGIPVFGIENIGYMYFREGSKIHITPEKAKQLSGYEALPRDILISRSGTVGEVCVVPAGLGEARISTNIMRVVVSEKKMIPIFFCYLFNGSPFVLSQVEELCKGSTRDFLNQTILKTIVFPLPPLPEQQEIVCRVEALFALADQIEARYTKTKVYVDKLTQSIFAKAFRGELVPQDPNDEPASVLLERIKAEKLKQEPKKRKNVKIRQTKRMEV